MARTKDSSRTEREARGDAPRLARRAFLSRSALASGALVAAPTLAATASGCGASLRHAMGGAEAHALLERLERGLGRVRDIPRGRIARELTWVARPDLTENMIKQTLEAFVIADVARSLPEGASVPQPLAGRLIEEAPVLGGATEAHHALLARMPGSARRRLDGHIRREPDLPTDVAGWIDRHAAELGTAPDSRLKLRLGARDVKARLRRQSANAVIDDCVRKVERVAARSGGSLALARSTTTTAMIDAIWQQVDGLPTGRGSGRGLSAPHLAAAVPGSREAQEDREWERFTDDQHRLWSARWARPGDEEVMIGSVMMPFGAITCGLLTLVGLVVLLAGVAQNASWDGEPREAQ